MKNEMRVADELRGKRAQVLRVAAKHGAGNVHLFGSVARGAETADSEVDFLVDVVGEPTPRFPGGWLRIRRNCSGAKFRSSSAGL